MDTPDGKLSIEEMLYVHAALHNPGYRFITTSLAGSRPIQRIDSVRDAQLFARVFIGPYQFLTQNVRKPSVNTIWVGEHSSHKLTWIIRSGTWVGRIREYEKDGEILVQLDSLQPEKVEYIGPARRFSKGEKGAGP